jgi:hypothetical protein
VHHSHAAHMRQKTTISMTSIRPSLPLGVSSATPSQLYELSDGAASWREPRLPRCRPPSVVCAPRTCLCSAIRGWPVGGNRRLTRSPHREGCDPSCPFLSAIQLYELGKHRLPEPLHSQSAKQTAWGDSRSRCTCPCMSRVAFATTDSTLESPTGTRRRNRLDSGLRSATASHVTMLITAYGLEGATLRRNRLSVRPTPSGPLQSKHPCHRCQPCSPPTP